MLEFEFWIDTGNAKTVSYHQLSYGVHEAKIMTEHIT